MKLLAKLFSCGKPRIVPNAVKLKPTDASRMRSEVTQADDFPGTSRFVNEYVNHVTSVVVEKAIGEKLGLKLYSNTVRVQSIEKGSALERHGTLIPVGSVICVVNSTPATEVNIRGLLRDCLNRSSASITLSAPSWISAGESRRSSNRENSSRSESSVMRGSVDLGVVPIDFNKLSRDSMKMWTRNASLPDPRMSWVDDELEGERRKPKRSSCEGIYHHYPHEGD